MNYVQQCYEKANRKTNWATAVKSDLSSKGEWGWSKASLIYSMAMTSISFIELIDFFVVVFFLALSFIFILCSSLLSTICVCSCPLSIVHCPCPYPSTFVTDVLVMNGMFPQKNKSATIMLWILCDSNEIKTLFAIVRHIHCTISFAFYAMLFEIRMHSCSGLIPFLNCSLFFVLIWVSRTLPFIKCGFNESLQQTITFSTWFLNEHT